MKKVLLVEDDALIREDCAGFISDMGYECVPVEDGKSAIDLITADSISVVLTDLDIPKYDGMEVLAATKEFDPTIPVIIFTGEDRIETVVKAMKNGAFDYIQKPFTASLIEVTLQKAFKHRDLQNEIFSLKLKIAKPDKLNNIIYESSIMRQIAKNVIKLARSRANVLIFGESGTGKELIARNIHSFSSRNDKPFIPLDCVSLPASLLESELFGFEKGAFTGAHQAKPGVFELADGGTLFLDEITEMDYHMQAKLLRVLQERKFRHIGGKSFIDVDVRIISATNRDPVEAVKEKKFREDLYYRLNVVPIYLPPLRERYEDIPLLVHHFISKYNPFSEIEIKGISGKAMNCLRNWHWPGNIRELENVIQRLISMADHDYIEYDHLPDSLKNVDNGQLDKSTLSLGYKNAKIKCLENFNKQYFSKLFKDFDGNISKVASAAGVSRKTIYRIMTDFNIQF